MLKVLISRLTDIPREYVKPVFFHGKRNLQNKVRGKLAGYQMPGSVFLVLCDLDSGDCEILKKDLLGEVAKDKADRTKIRIACHELESFYLGDLLAVEQGIGVRNLSRKQDKNPYRNPDKRMKPSQEMAAITGGKYQKVAGSEKIAPHLRLDGANKSESFQMLVRAIKDLHSIWQQPNTPS